MLSKISMAQVAASLPAPALGQHTTLRSNRGPSIAILQHWHWHVGGLVTRPAQLATAYCSRLFFSRRPAATLHPLLHDCCCRKLLLLLLLRRRTASPSPDKHPAAG